jgi:hypothetical protein
MSADGSAVALRADEPKKHAMISVVRFVQEHRRRSARIEDHYIQVPVIIDAAESGASSRIHSPGIEPRLMSHFLESEIAPVAKIRLHTAKFSFGRETEN